MKKANMQESCSFLNRIEQMDQEIAEFLCQHGYDGRLDIVNPEESLIKAGMQLTYDFTAAQDALYKVAKEQEEKGRTEITLSALALSRRLSKLGEEIFGQI